MKRPAQPMEKVTFQKRIETGRDGHGSSTAHWADQLTAFVSIDFRTGAEEVFAGYVAGKSPGILTIRNTAKAREIDRTWRLKHRDRVFQIKEPPRVSPNRTHIIMTIEGTS